MNLSRVMLGAKLSGLLYLAGAGLLYALWRCCKEVPSVSPTVDGQMASPTVSSKEQWRTGRDHQSG